MLAVLVALAGVLLVWPQAFGLSRSLPFTQIVSFRLIGLLALGGTLLLALILVLASRPARALLGASTVVLLVLTIAAAAIFLGRGISSNGAEPSGEAGAVRVVSWNTRGDEPGSPTIADLAIARTADVVVLPETTEEMGREVAALMAEAGMPMQVFATTTAEGYRATSTTVLVAEHLGEYEVTEEFGTTTTVATTIVIPVSGSGPRIVAAHAVSPTQTNMEKWREDLSWLADRCDGNTIMAGDFNATLDHFSGLGVDGGQLGTCRDAALAANSASLGTWTSGKPPLFVPAIDHVLASEDWRVTGFDVVTTDDRAGSDHRPIVAELVPRG